MLRRATYQTSLRSSPSNTRVGAGSEIPFLIRVTDAPPSAAKAGGAPTFAAIESEVEVTEKQLCATADAPGASRDRTRHLTRDDDADETGPESKHSHGEISAQSHNQRGIPQRE
jgi:hypothetical protein